MHASTGRLIARAATTTSSRSRGSRWRPTCACARCGAAGRTSGPRSIFDDHNAEYVLQQRAFLTDVARPRRWVGAAYSLVQWRKLTGYERRVCRTADRVVAVSEADRQALRQLGAGAGSDRRPQRRGPRFLPAGRRPPAAGMGRQRLVFTGKMDYRPNVDAVLWFADAGAAADPGADSRRPLLRRRPAARTRGWPALAEPARRHGHRPRARHAALHRGRGVYVVPLRIGGGTRLKVLEAMAMGQAIVSTQLGCDGFAFEDGGEVRFADDPAAFAETAVALLRDRAQAAALGGSARAYVEAHYGWDAIVPRLEALYV